MTQSQVLVVPTWTVGDRLRKARESTGLSQAELGQEIGVSKRSISTYENSSEPPRKPVLLSWALRCGVPVSWLTDGETPAPTTPQSSGQGVIKERYRPRLHGVSTAFLIAA